MSLRSRLWLGPIDGAVEDVEVFDALLDELALLHRDPQAERSRLVTRRFVTACVARWWDTDDSELLRAQIILYRFVDRHQAALSAADGWSELSAGGADFIMIEQQRLALVAEQREGEPPFIHAAAIASRDEMTFVVTTISTDRDIALRRCAGLARSQLTMLEQP
jgi:hypothetical protein